MAKLKPIQIAVKANDAEFFYNSVMGIAKIGHALTEKFSNNDSVLLMIENKQNLLTHNT